MLKRVVAASFLIMAVWAGCSAGSAASSLQRKEGLRDHVPNYYYYFILFKLLWLTNQLMTI